MIYLSKEELYICCRSMEYELGVEIDVKIVRFIGY